MMNKKRLSELTVNDIESIYASQSDFVESNHPVGDKDFMELIKKGADKVNEFKVQEYKRGE